MAGKLIYDGRMDRDMILEQSRRLLFGVVEPVKTRNVPIFPGLVFPHGIEIVPFGYGIHDDPESRSLDAVEGE